MMERDQKMKITHKAATTYRKALTCCVDRSPRALSVRKKSATPWIMLTRVSSMLITTESSSWRPLLGGFTTRLVTAQRLNCQGASRSGSDGASLGTGTVCLASARWVNLTTPKIGRRVILLERNPVLGCLSLWKFTEGFVPHGIRYPS